MAKTHKMTLKECLKLCDELIKLKEKYMELKKKWRWAEIIDEDDKNET